MNKKGTLLIIDDNKSILSTLKLLLSGIFGNVITLNTPVQLLHNIDKKEVDVVLLDMNFGNGVNNGNEGLYWLRAIKKKYHDKCQVVLITAYADIELAIEGMKSGASDFIIKPWDNDKLIKVLKHAYKQKNIAKQTKKANKIEEVMFWGKSSKMKEIAELVKKVGETDANILIYGENGTGKEVLAREIHSLSKRSKNSMVTVDMGAISENLFESELFGHCKGAFTDAKIDRKGKFEVADNSTLFLDEIGNIPMYLQSKLLSVLQQRNVTPVGSNEERNVDIRLISATNMNIDKMIQEGQFRVDLLYRINTISITIPPLRERKEDIIPLCKLFMSKYAQKYNKEVRDIQPELVEMLENHRWDGNIRELQHTMEKAVIMCNRREIQRGDIILSKNSNSITPTADNSNFETFDEMEQYMIQLAIEKYGSNISLVAQSLGVSRQTMYNKMKKYNM